MYSLELKSYLIDVYIIYCLSIFSHAYSYILSLALADLLVILVCVPVATIVYTQDSWPFERNMCRITEFFKDISIGVSVFTLTALSGERYCAIVNPLRKLQVSAKSGSIVKASNLLSSPK